MFVLRNCSLVPELTEGTDLKKADVMLENSRIKRILPCGSFAEGEYETLDLNGKTLLPGLIDAHVHLHMGKEYVGLMIKTACGRAFDCLKYAQYLLDIGITTVRDMGDDVNFPTVALRNAIREGVVKGPRLKTSGVTIIPYDNGFQADPDICAYTCGPVEMRKQVRYMFMNDVDLIKIYGTGSMMTQGSEPGIRILEEDEISEAVKIAARKGTYVACHCHGAEAIGVMARLGVRTIEHASFITDETCRYLDGRTDVGIVPTVGITADEVISRKNSEERERYEILREKIYASLKNAYRYNILMGWGTDFPLSVYEKYPYIEFKTRKEKLGYSNLDLLKQATINSARLLMMDQEIGTLKEGKLADLIVVDGDPIEDITVMYTRPDHVIKDGELIR